MTNATTTRPTIRRFSADEIVTVATCCAAYRLQAIDAAFPSTGDAAGLLADAEFAKSIGLKGKNVIDPSQVDAVNRVFAGGD